MTYKRLLYFKVSFKNILETININYEKPIEVFQWR